MLVSVNLNTYLLSVVVGLMALIYSLHELSLVSLPHPERQKQVPVWWKYRFHPYTMAGLFGFLLGIGFMTFIPTATFYIVMLIAVFSGSLIYSTSIFLLFGIARAMPLGLVGRTIRGVQTIERFQAFISLTKPVVRQFNGALLAAFGTYSLIGAALGH